MTLACLAPGTGDVEGAKGLRLLMSDGTQKKNSELPTTGDEIRRPITKSGSNYILYNRMFWDRICGAALGKAVDET